ncbi:hypothetical protein [Bartonella sp. HY406]|uniref:hypothetical protein n=1 Tax=Bartonella sp. HY406 TaxID=2979331 RepID=UPI0021C64360|nr:hypothetical protein [Bartonella sp. HY406]UXN03892.1 hypothetical protein N6B01_02305 [Bartonella sp. HY406]
MLKKLNKIIMFIAYAAMLALCIILLVVSFSKAQDKENNERLAVLGTPVTMQPPQGFKPSAEFTGFLNQDTNASIVVAVFPDDVAPQIGSLFTNRENFTKQMAALGFEVQGVSELQRINSDVPLMVYKGIQTDQGKKYDKWATLIAHGGLYMVTIQAPQDNPLSEEEVDAAFQSIDFTANFTLADQILHLPFSFVSEAPFEPKATILGNGVSLEMKDATGKTGDATIFILRDSQALDINNAILAQNLYLASIIKVFKLQETTIERDEQFLQRNGRLLIGSGVSADGAEQDIILYSAIDNDQHPIYLQALAPKGELAAYQAIIQNIAASVKSKL